MSQCPYCSADYNEEDCAHFVFVYDRTFPFASGNSSCPLSIESHRFDTKSLDELDDAVGKVVAAILGGTATLASLKRLPKRLSGLVSEIHEGSTLDEDGELERDSYVGLRAYKEYVDTCLYRSPRKVRSDSFEQNIPCFSSAYSEFWSREGSTVIDYLEGTFRSDAEQLEEALEKALEPKPPARQPKKPTAKSAAKPSAKPRSKPSDGKARS